MELHKVDIPWSYSDVWSPLDRHCLVRGESTVLNVKPTGCWMNIKCNGLDYCATIHCKARVYGRKHKQHDCDGVGIMAFSTQHMEMHKRNSKTLTFQQKKSAKQSKSAKENNAFSLPHPQRKYQTLQQLINSISYSQIQEGFYISGGLWKHANNSDTSVLHFPCTLFLAICPPSAWVNNLVTPHKQPFIY